MFKRILWISLPVLLLGCETFDRPEEVPSYVYIAPFTLSTDAGSEGENTHAIRDAWVYHNGNLIGIYELPARVPVMGEGTQNLTLRPGIQNNGVSADRTIYPFYEPYHFSGELYRDSVVNIQPSTQYVSGLEFELDDFESAGQLLVKANNSDTSWVIETNGGVTGKYGRLILDGSKILAAVHTDENYNLPKQGAEVYLEMDVRTNNIIRFGVIDEVNGASNKVYNNFGVNSPSNGEGPTWKKLYFELTNTLSFESQAIQHEFFIDVIKDDGVSVTVADFDNIKIVHYQ